MKEKLIASLLRKLKQQVLMLLKQQWLFLKERVTLRTWSGSRPTWHPGSALPLKNHCILLPLVSSSLKCNIGRNDHDGPKTVTVEHKAVLLTEKTLLSKPPLSTRVCLVSAQTHTSLFFHALNKTKSKAKTYPKPSTPNKHLFTKTLSKHWTLLHCILGYL